MGIQESGNPDELNLDEAMQATLNDIRGRDTQEPEPEPEPETEPTKEEIETEPEPEPEPEPEGEPEQEEQEPDPEAEPEPEQENKSALRAPSSWSAQAKAAFYDLPEHIQKEVEKREQDFHKGISQYKENADFGQKLNKVIQPYEAHLRASGQPVDQVVSTMLNAAYRLGQGTPQQKAEYLLQIAQESGADLQSLMKSGDNTTGQNNSDPYVKKLEQRLAQLEGFTTQQVTLSQRQQEQQIQSEIQKFENAVDEGGKPQHPFFKDVEADMASLITMAKQQGRQLSLNDAYEQAVWARPDTRQAMLATQQQQATQKQRESQAQKAAKAKKAASVNVRSTPTAQRAKSQEPVGSIDDTMRQTLASMRGKER